MSRSFADIGKELSAKRVLVDGGVMSALLGAIVMASLAYDAEMWHQDYPPDIQERAGPMSERAKRERLVVAAPLFAILFGAPVLSNLKLKRERGGELSFAAAAANAYAVWLVFNLFDLLVLDYLILIGLNPRFAVLAGTEGMPSYRDLRFPFLGFLKGLVVGLIPSLLIARLTMRKQPPRRRRWRRW